MGAKFIVDRRCAVKKEWTLIGLVEAIKRRGLMGEIEDLVAAGAMAEPLNDARLESLPLERPGVPGQMSLQNLKAESDGLMRHKITCRQCSASLYGRVGGCIGYIPYPISEGVEYLLWVSAVKGLKGQWPSPFNDATIQFAEKAMQRKETPFAADLRRRKDLLRSRPWVYRTGAPWNRRQLTSAQVLEEFFHHEGLLARDDVKLRADFLSAVLLVARAMKEAITDPEQRQALVEDVEPYAQLRQLLRMTMDLKRDTILVWP